MNKIYFVLIIGLFCFLYAGLNYYIGFKGWQSLGRFIPFLNSKVYWSLFWLVAASYFIGSLGAKVLSGNYMKIFTWVGAYWLAAMFYLILILAVVEVARIINRWVNFLPEEVKENPRFVFSSGMFVLLLVIGILVYGTWNGQNPQINHYNITIPKKVTNINKLHVVMISDIHLGTIVDNNRLIKMVEMVEELDPDLVLFAGDIVNENIDLFMKQHMGHAFRRLKPKYGCFAVLGNHEYIGGNVENIIYHLEDAGIHVLRDSYLKIASSFYISGRDDLAVEYYRGQKRLSLSSVLNGVDRTLPVILLDHQPRALEEAREQGVDLLFSGHTHRGQVFPGNLITKKIFEIDWGYLKKGSLQVIVSSGFGTWGPPIRVGNQPEIIDVLINFASPQK